jgi:hypothetical protein
MLTVQNTMFAAFTYDVVGIMHLATSQHKNFCRMDGMLPTTPDSLCASAWEITSATIALSLPNA